MNRAAWLKEKRRMAEYRYDTIFSRDYDEKYGRIDPTHKRFLEKLLAACPEGCTILDAACGTGKYWPLIVASGRTVLGIDQSAEMLKKATAKHPGVVAEKIGLQEMHFANEFHGMICIDAMENVFPEDWPLVLDNFRKALKPGGHLYFTVELAPEDEIQQAFIRGKELGLPVVKGEWAHEGGYHYYPSSNQVKDWLAGAGFYIIDESCGDGYMHYFVRKV